MTTGLPFDIVITDHMSDVICLRKEEPCALSDKTISYTYVKNITLNLSDSIPINVKVENEVRKSNI
jgi:hypothetical protein